MSRKKKVITILHLGFALVYLLLILFQPFLQDSVIKKSEKALFETVFDHQEFFDQLPSEEQSLLVKGYQEERFQEKPSYFAQLLKNISLFSLIWLSLSLVVPVLLFYQIKETYQAVWLLPLSILLYGYFSTAFPKSQPDSPLFPSQEYVLANYSNNPNPSFIDKREELLKGWHRYLIAEWGHEKPSLEETVFQEQLERSLFAFNVKRLHFLIDGQGDILLAGFAAPPSLLQLSFYFLWNLFFAWFLNRKETFSKSAPQSLLS